MLRINQIKIPYKESTDQILPYIVKKLHIRSEDILRWSIFKKSIDARKKEQIMAVYTIDLEHKNESQFLKKNRNKNIRSFSPVVYQFPEEGHEKIPNSIVIVGSGPSGLFAALMLARHGYKPILIEQGADVEERQRIVNAFWEKGQLDPLTNVQFGEGGAGTFSDGKLNTLVKDPYGRHKKVLEIFVEFGADPSILYENKPHIGTDVLSKIVKNMRNEIIRCGGDVRFHTKLTDLRVADGKLTAVCFNHREWVDCQTLILAIGHSARDTFYMLHKHQLTMTPKSFAIGVRIEHPQKMINQSQYGMEYDEILGSAPYKLTHTTSNGRGVYTFCMCPGGHVVNASSEAHGTVVNGMSYHARNSKNANSALIVTVTPDDFPSDMPLAGIEFQRIWERKAYEIGHGHVPVQLYEDFCKNQISTKFNEIEPIHKGAVEFANLNQCLPSYVCDSLKEGIEAFSLKIKNYNRKDAILSGVETRTSSPVRIERDSSFQSNIQGIFPCGEGAGYAGGITSAAMDGLRVAEALRKTYQSDRRKTHV